MKLVEKEVKVGPGIQQYRDESCYQEDHIRNQEYLVLFEKVPHFGSRFSVLACLPAGRVLSSRLPAGRQGSQFSVPNRVSKINFFMAWSGT
jgi:hypothetical protein